MSSQSNFPVAGEELQLDCSQDFDSHSWGVPGRGIGMGRNAVRYQTSWETR